MSVRVLLIMPLVSSSGDGALLKCIPIAAFGDKLSCLDLDFTSFDSSCY